jgi:hypothetical protein
MKRFKAQQPLTILMISLMLICSSLALVGPAKAAKKAEVAQYMTKGDVVQILANSEIVQKKIKELFSWTSGYDASKINRGRFTPTINFVKLIPRAVPPDDRTVFEVAASVDDPFGLTNIAGVRADLSSIGRLPNTALVDNGLYGDQQASDGVYTLQTSVAQTIPLGNRDIQITATNKKGWLALAKATVDVRKNPVIVSTRFVPEKALAADGSLVTMEVRIDNPGGVANVRSVVANFWPLGLSDRTVLWPSASEGEFNPDDKLWKVEFVLSAKVAAGMYKIPVEVTNLSGGVAVGSGVLMVVK